jgi:hypothetical protein
MGVVAQRFIDVGIGLAMQALQTNVGRQIIATRAHIESHALKQCLVVGDMALPMVVLGARSIHCLLYACDCICRGWLVEALKTGGGGDY